MSAALEGLGANAIGGDGFETDTMEKAYQLSKRSASRTARWQRVRRWAAKARNRRGLGLFGGGSIFARR